MAQNKNKEHYSMKVGDWRPCDAPSPDRCPMKFKDENGNIIPAPHSSDPAEKEKLLEQIHGKEEIFKANPDEDRGVVQNMRTIEAGMFAEHNVFLVGMPATAKTSLWNQWAKANGYEVVTLIGANMDLSDIEGIPSNVDREYVDEEGNVHSVAVASNILPDWQYDVLKNKKVLIFLDEFSNTPPNIQAGMLNMIQTRSFAKGRLKMPKETLILAAMNSQADSPDPSPLSKPMANRAMHLEWDIPMKAVEDHVLGKDTHVNRMESTGYARYDWYDPEKSYEENLAARRDAVGEIYDEGYDELLYVKQQEYYKLMTEYWTARPEEFRDMDPDEVRDLSSLGLRNSNEALEAANNAFTTPRSWVKCMDTLATFDMLDSGYAYPKKMSEEDKEHEREAIRQNIIRANLGPGAAAAFLDWKKDREQLNLDAVIEDPKKVDFNKVNSDQLLIMANQLPLKATKQNLDNIIEVYTKIHEAGKASDVSRTIKGLIKRICEPDFKATKAQLAKANKLSDLYEDLTDATNDF